MHKENVVYSRSCSSATWRVGLRAPASLWRFVKTNGDKENSSYDARLCASTGCAEGPKWSPPCRATCAGLASRGRRENPRAWWSGPLGFLMLPGLPTIATVLGMVPWQGEGVSVRRTRGSHTCSEMSFSKLFSYPADVPQSQ